MVNKDTLMGSIFLTIFSYFGGVAVMIPEKEWLIFLAGIGVYFSGGQIMRGSKK